MPPADGESLPEVPNVGLPPNPSDEQVRQYVRARAKAHIDSAFETLLEAMTWGKMRERIAAVDRLMVLSGVVSSTAYAPPGGTGQEDERLRDSQRSIDVKIIQIIQQIAPERAAELRKGLGLIDVAAEELTDGR